jgi:hypothetical protein
VSPVQVHVTLEATSLPSTKFLAARIDEWSLAM